MQKLFLGIVIALFSIGLAAGGWYAYTMRSSSASVDLGTASPSPSTEETTTFTGSITALLQRGGNVTCTFQHSSASNSGDGTVFVAGKKLRGEFFFKNAESGSTQMNMINDGEYVYTWIEAADGKTLAAKTKAEDVEVFSTNAATQEQSSLPANDLDGELTYSCRPWLVDATKFAVPTDVTFTDMSAQMEQMQNSVPGMKESQCEACDRLPAEAQAACKAQLGC